jgi:hypothetical protein
VTTGIRRPIHGGTSGFDWPTSSARLKQQFYDHTITGEESNKLTDVLRVAYGAQIESADCVVIQAAPIAVPRGTTPGPTYWN